MTTTITLNDVKNAILSAWTLWWKEERGKLYYKLESGEYINLSYTVKGRHDNYGIPNKYVMNEGEIPNLQAWWNAESGKYQGTGSVDPPHDKTGSKEYAVNVVYKSVQRYKIFNFHVPIDK